MGVENANPNCTQHYGSSEYIALSQAMRDLIPIREILKELLNVVFKTDAEVKYHAYAHAFQDANIESTTYSIPPSTVYEDNGACLKFARMPKLTPRTKHIGIPYHLFRSQVETLQIHIEPIDTKDQLADQFPSRKLCTYIVIINYICPFKPLLKMFTIYIGNC